MSFELFGQNRSGFGPAESGEDIASLKARVQFLENTNPTISPMGRIAPKLNLNSKSPDLFVRVPSGAMAKSANHKLKRALDFSLAFFGLIFLLPFFALVAALIMIDSKGKPIFKQTRTGLGGRQFKIWKFRTMTVCESGINMTQAQRNDARITKIGAFLRQTSIDELPQLINVLRGEMSLVGPRPHAIAHDIHFGTLINEYCQRFRTRPGITGLAQISGARGPTPSISIMAKRIEYDIEYIENWSLLNDIRILFKTATGFAFHDAF